MSINSVTLLGRLARDPELRHGQNTEVCRFTIACDRNKKDAPADFISCVCFGQSATYLDRYGSKGDPIAITGRIQTGSYDDKDGRKVYTTDIVADRVELAGGRKSGSSGSSTPTGNSTTYTRDIANSVTEIDDVPIDPNEDLPF